MMNILTSVLSGEIFPPNTDCVLHLAAPAEIFPLERRLLTAPALQLHLSLPGDQAPPPAGNTQRRLCLGRVHVRLQHATW